MIVGNVLDTLGMIRLQRTFRELRLVNTSQKSVTIILLFQAYIFDVRSSSYLHKLIGHTDTVAQVAYHPLHPQVSIWANDLITYFHYMFSLIALHIN